jgi:hypothetical protein
MNGTASWGRRIYERHLDLLLAEELSCRPAFARWMIERCVVGFKLPAGDPDEVIVEISHDDDIGDDPAAAGENDLFMEARWSDGTCVRLLIEDKLDAVVQPRQFERYLSRIQFHGALPGISAAGGAAVAPAGYLKGHSADLGPLTAISVEDIADRLVEDAERADPEVARRLRWRADRLVSIRQSTRVAAPDDGETIAMRDWIIDRLARAEPSARPNAASMRTKFGGWLYFDDPKCLIYKLYHGYVDIYLRDIWPNDPEKQTLVHQSGDLPEGFTSEFDTKKNLILRSVVHRAMRRGDVDLSDPADVADLEQGVAACAAAVKWSRAALSSTVEEPLAATIPGHRTA